MQKLSYLADRYLNWLTLPDFGFTDALEILILAFLFYRFFKWIKDTRAWMLLRGLIIILAFFLFAWILQMNTILWIAGKLLSIMAISVVVVFRPEIRRFLEKLGESNLLLTLFPPSESANDAAAGSMTDRTIDRIVDACFDMGRAKTGALIVVERKVLLREYETTGVSIDALISRQLIKNIFEHNTPLHDGAVLIRGNRIIAATCYLPLSENRKISKDLGTRHRAALGTSEVSDALVIVVSEETGRVSYAMGGELYVGVTADVLRKAMQSIRDESAARSGFHLWIERRKQ